MTKDLTKAIMEKSKTRNKYFKWPSIENYVSYKKSKNKCNSLTKKAKKIFLKEARKDGIMSNEKFLSNQKELVELLNQNYINIVENSSSKKPSSLGDCINASEDEITVKEIILVYNNHPSI